MVILNASAHPVDRSQNNSEFCQSYRGTKTFKIIYRTTPFYFESSQKLPYPLFVMRF